jgi:hypothetical protein
MGKWITRPLAAKNIGTRSIPGQATSGASKVSYSYEDDGEVLYRLVLFLMTSHSDKLPRPPKKHK